MLNDENAFEINQGTVVMFLSKIVVEYATMCKSLMSSENEHFNQKGFEQARKNATTERYILFVAIRGSYKAGLYNIDNSLL